MMYLKFLLNFEKCLLNNSFYKIENIFFDKHVYVKMIGANGYIVIPIFKDSIHYKEHFNIIENRSKLMLKRYSLSKIFIFKILVSDSFDEDDNRFLNCELNLDSNVVNILWGIDTINKKIITKSNQPTKFLDIEKYIYLSLEEDFKYEKKKRKKYVISNNTYSTYILIFVMVLLYGVIDISPFVDKSISIYNYGISPDIFKNNQYYRFFTFLFLHSNLGHLLSNILMLYVFGSRIERYLGKIPFFLIFFIGGVFSGIFSIIFTKTYSIGASGAIFALESAALYFSIKEKIKLDGLDYSILFILSIVSILGSFWDYRVDNAGHIGGFIGGFIACYIYYNTIYKFINK